MPRALIKKAVSAWRRGAVGGGGGGRRITRGGSRRANKKSGAVLFSFLKWPSLACAYIIAHPRSERGGRWAVVRAARAGGREGRDSTCRLA
jgi:hypothetical protein